MQVAKESRLSPRASGRQSARGFRLEGSDGAGWSAHRSSPDRGLGLPGYAGGRRQCRTCPPNCFRGRAPNSGPELGLPADLLSLAWWAMLICGFF